MKDTRVLAMEDVELRRLKDSLEEISGKGVAISGICTVLDKISLIKSVGEREDDHGELWSEISTEAVRSALYMGIDSLTREIVTESARLRERVRTWEVSHDH